MLSPGLQSQNIVLAGVEAFHNLDSSSRFSIPQSLMLVPLNALIKVVDAASKDRHLLFLAARPQLSETKKKKNETLPSIPTAMPTSPPRRTALINRNTNETKIQVSLALDGGPLDPLPDDADFSAESVAPNAPIPPQTTGHHASQLAGSQQIWIWTGIGFLDHMLHAWSKHAGWSLRVRCRGDLASTLQIFVLDIFLFGWSL